MKKYLMVPVILGIILFAAGNAAANSGASAGEKLMKPALLVIDIQKCFLKWMDKEDSETALPQIPRAIQLFRELSLPVIAIYHDDPKTPPAPGEEDFEFPEDIPITKKDIRVIKTYGNAFTKTELDNILKEKGCNTVFLCGLSSVGCVLATYVGAMDHDYKAFMIKDGLMSHKARYTDCIEEIYMAIGLEEVKSILEKHSK